MNHFNNSPVLSARPVATTAVAQNLDDLVEIVCKTNSLLVRYFVVANKTRRFAVHSEFCILSFFCLNRDNCVCLLLIGHCHWICAFFSFLMISMHSFHDSGLDGNRLFDGQMDSFLYYPVDFRRSKSGIIECILGGICHRCHIVVVFDDIFAQSQGPDRPLRLERLLSQCRTSHGNYPTGDIFVLDTCLVAIVGILGTVLRRITDHGVVNGYALCANIGFILKKTARMISR
jgi:hypothetical protein